MPSIAIFAQSKAQVAYLGEVVRLAGGCIHDAGDKEPVLSLSQTKDGLTIMQGEEEQKVAIPLRAASLAGLIRKRLQQADSTSASLKIGDGMLDVRDFLWLREGDAPLRLTEKEVAILVTLNNAGGKPVSRQRLLDEVWAYAQGVETHTLETHVYRLRQKIEIDPAMPKILLTHEEGYRIALPDSL